MFSTLLVHDILLLDSDVLVTLYYRFDRVARFDFDRCRGGGRTGQKTCAAVPCRNPKV